MDASREQGPVGPAVLDRLPHRPPFRFVTGVRELDAGRAGRGTWSITGDEWFLTGHFPADPVVPGVLIIEALAQLSGLVGLHTGAPGGPSGDGRAGRLVQADVRFDRGVVPPADIDLVSTMSRSMQSLRQFDVSAWTGGVVVARGSLVLAEVG